jgi:hypothetical protein
MRKSDTATVTAEKTAPSRNRGEAPVELVCLGLALATLALALRIAISW